MVSESNIDTAFALSLTHAETTKGAAPVAVFLKDALTGGPAPVRALESKAHGAGLLGKRQAIVLLIAYGALVISLVDNLLRPFLIGSDTKMPEYLVLISTLGGIAIFGLNGFIIGPVIAAMFMAAWEIFSASRQSTPSDRASE